MNVLLNRFVLSFGLVFSIASYSENIPKLPQNLRCVNFQQVAMNFNNSTVVQWRNGTPNQYKDRGFVKGPVTDVYPRKRNSKGKTHTHFAIDLDQKPGGDIELIYNDEFGDLPNIAVGMQVIACGDYITANAQSQLPSPMGAIIHWIHYNPGNRDGGAHPHGFVIVNNTPYGLTAPELQ